MVEVKIDAATIRSLIIEINEMKKELRSMNEQAKTIKVKPVQQFFSNKEACAYCGFKCEDTLRKWAKFYNITRSNTGKWEKKDLDFLLKEKGFPTYRSRN